MRDEILYGLGLEVCELISNFIPHFEMDVIIYPFCD